MVPGGARGLQNRWRVSFDALGGSTPLASAIQLLAGNYQYIPVPDPSLLPIILRYQITHLCGGNAHHRIGRTVVDDYLVFGF